MSLPATTESTWGSQRSRSGDAKCDQPLPGLVAPSGKTCQTPSTSTEMDVETQYKAPSGLGGRGHWRRQVWEAAHTPKTSVPHNVHGTHVRRTRHQHRQKRTDQHCGTEGQREYLRLGHGGRRAERRRRGQGGELVAGCGFNAVRGSVISGRSRPSLIRSLVPWPSDYPRPCAPCGRYEASHFRTHLSLCCWPKLWP